MHKIFLVLSLTLSIVTSAQFLQDITGLPYLQKNLGEEDGSPMLFASWVKATVMTASGKSYNDMLVNVDLIQDMPIFLKGENVLTFSDEINEFALTDGTTTLKFKRGISIDPSFSRAFMEVMSDSLKIIKKYSKALVEVPTYANANKRYRYAEAVVYYAFLNGKYEKIPLTKENAQKVFAAKWTDIKTYAEDNKISFKKDEDWRKLIQYYQAANH